MSCTEIFRPNTFRRTQAERTYSLTLSGRCLSNLDLNQGRMCHTQKHSEMMVRSLKIKWIKGGGQSQSVTNPNPWICCNIILSADIILHFLFWAKQFYSLANFVFLLSKALAKRRRKFAKTELVYGLAMPVAKWVRKSACKFTQFAKSRKFTHIQLTYDQFVSTCVGWPNGEKLASTCVRIWARPKSTQVNTSEWPNETQVERKSKTSVDSRIRLARAWDTRRQFLSL